jgi:hypothetical protein
MSERAFWPVAFLIALMMLLVSVLLIAKVDVGSIVAVFALVGSLASGVAGLFAVHKIGKVQADVARVEHNTNGSTSDDKAMLRDLMEYVKHSTPTPKDD